VNPSDFSCASTAAALLPARSTGTVTGGAVEVVGVEVSVAVELEVVVGVGITGTVGEVGVVPQALARVSAASTQTILLVATIFVSVQPTGSS